MKDRIKIAALLIAACSWGFQSRAISLDDIQFWTGSGTNRAAMVIEWSVPESLTNSSVPVPVVDKTLVWGYRFDGTATTGSQMVKAILAADPRLYMVGDVSWGLYIQGIGYNLSGNGLVGITDGKATNSFLGGLLTSPTVSLDSARAIASGDLFWSGWMGPNWELWTESGAKGGFTNSPNRGTNAYWTPTDFVYYSAGLHGQWDLAQSGLDGMTLTNGSWIGFSMSAGEYEALASAPYNAHKHAPVGADGAYVAYVCNTNDFGAQIVSSTNVYTTSPYNDPLAMLGRPSLLFSNAFGDVSVHRVKIVEAPYNVAADGSKVITEINSGGQVTVNMGRNVFDDPNNPYGIDLILYGNSFFSGSGAGTIGDKTDMNAAILSSSLYGHPAVVSVSQDGVNWFTYSNSVTPFPQNAYRWDGVSHAWTAEPSNPTKPLNPTFAGTALGGMNAAAALDRFMGSAGGTGFDLKASGFPWIRYVRVEPSAGTYAVIDAIAAVNPVSVGDVLSITPDNVASGLTNLVFQNSANLSQTLVSVNFSSVSGVAKISASALNEVSAYAPVTGIYRTGYKLAASPISGTGSISLAADLSLNISNAYSGNGADLVVSMWNGTGWNQLDSAYNTNTRVVQISPVSQLSAVAVSQLPPVEPSIRLTQTAVQLGFTPVAGRVYTVERSTDLVHWTAVSSMTAATVAPISVSDTRTQDTAVFYRVRFGK